jgi:RecA/RadA recombinase
MLASMASNVDSIRKKLPRLQLDQRSSEESEMKRDMKKHVEKMAREPLFET